MSRSISRVAEFARRKRPNASAAGPCKERLASFVYRSAKDNWPTWSKRNIERDRESTVVRFHQILGHGNVCSLRRLSQRAPGAGRFG